MVSVVVKNNGYLTLEDVLKLEYFSIYETHKNTHILVVGTSWYKVDYDKLSLSYPKEDRLPYKTVEGKKICKGTKVFDSQTDPLYNIDRTKWNNGNQIMSYSIV